jgi:hypothetical protein
MKKFILKGLPEGLLGKSVLHSKNVNTLFLENPVLKKIRKKLTISKSGEIRGFLPCDG